MDVDVSHLPCTVDTIPTSITIDFIGRFYDSAAVEIAGTTPLTPPPRRQHAAARCPQTRSPGGEMRHRVASSGARGGKENASTAHEQSYSNRCSSLRKNIFLLLLL